MLKLAWLVARKDLKITLASFSNLAQAVLLGLLIIFLFSLARPAGAHVPAEEAASIFWIGTLFCQILIFGRIYALEEVNGSKHGLALLSLPIQGIWLGKACAALPLCVGSQVFFLAAAIVFLGQNTAGPWLPGIISLFLADGGICILGSLLGALGQGGGRNAIFTILLFPLLAPLLLAAITLGGITLGSENNTDINMWYAVAVTFDALFLGASLLLFGFIYKGEA